MEHTHVIGTRIKKHCMSGIPQAPLFLFLVSIAPPRVTVILTSTTVDYFQLFLNILCSYVCGFLTLHNIYEIRKYSLCG